jgi:hypothetical protein
MGAPLGWQGWQYVKEIVERTERSRLSCVEFSVMLWQRFVGLNQGEQLSVIPAERFQGPVESVAPVASRGRVRGQPTMDLYPSIH